GSRRGGDEGDVLVLGLRGSRGSALGDREGRKNERGERQRQGVNQGVAGLVHGVLRGEWVRRLNYKARRKARGGTRPRIRPSRIRASSVTIRYSPVPAFPPPGRPKAREPAGAAPARAAAARRMGRMPPIS